jgi:hypothetical protein
MRSILNGGSADQSDSTAKSVTEQVNAEGQTEGSAPAMSKFKTGGFKKAFVPVDTSLDNQSPAMNPASANVDDDLDGEAMEMDDDIDGVAVGADDLDGEAMGDDDLDGTAMGNDDLDGVALADDEDDLDGVAMVD